MHESTALDLLFVMLFASHETTSTVLTVILKYLTDNPKALQELTVSRLSYLICSHNYLIVSGSQGKYVSTEHTNIYIEFVFGCVMFSGGAWKNSRKKGRSRLWYHVGGVQVYEIHISCMYRHNCKKKENKFEKHTNISCPWQNSNGCLGLICFLWHIGYTWISKAGKHRTGHVQESRSGCAHKWYA